MDFIRRRHPTDNGQAPSLPMESIHLVIPGSGKLVSPYRMHESSRPIEPADSFGVRIHAVVVAEDLDRLLAGANDILVMTRSSLAGHPRIERIHFYGEEIERGTPIHSMLADRVHVVENVGSADRLWLEFVVTEVDADRHDRQAAVDTFRHLAGGAGSIFPCLLPYTAGAAAAYEILDKALAVLNADTPVIRKQVSFHAGATGPGQMPLQEGSYVALAEPLDPDGIRLHPNGLLEFRGRRLDKSYVTFGVTRETAVPRADIIGQHLAGLLSKLGDAGEGHAAVADMDLLRRLVDDADTLARLKRFHALAAKPGRTAAEDRALAALLTDADLRALIEGRADPPSSST